MREVSVIIPSRNELKNLKWTLQAAMADLEQRDYELIAVLNRCNPDDKEHLERYWPFKTGRGQVIEYNDKPSCWQSRNVGAEAATGKYLLFLDSHVIPSPGSYSRLIDFHEGWKGVAHCALNYWLEPHVKSLYGYAWRPEKFWGNWTRQKPKPPDYKIPLSGTSCSLIDREVFEEVRGFHPALGIYGGGEPYIDLKVQMWGYDVRLHPDNYLWHLTETRGYSWNNEDLRRNFMIAAYALGGQRYLVPVFDHFWKACKGVEKYEENLIELRDEAITLAADDLAFVEANAKYTLPELEEMWKDYR